MTTPRPPVSWSPWDRFLWIILGLIFTLVFGLELWFRALDQNPVVSIPTPTTFADNAFNFYKAAGDAVVDSGKVGWAMSGLPPGQKPSGDSRSYSLTEKKALVAENAGAFLILHMGFAYPYQEPPVRSFPTPLPHYAGARGLARLLSLQAQVKAAQGDWNGAMNAHLDAIQLGETLPRGGPLGGAMVGDSCQGIGRRHVWEAIGHLNAAQARAAARRLERVRAGHVPFAATLLEAKWSGQAGLRELMGRHDWPRTLEATLGPGDASGGNSEVSWQQRGDLLRILLIGKRAVMANYTRYMDQAIATAQQPYATHPAAPPMPTDPVSQLLLPDYSGARLHEAEADTQNALLLTRLALHAYTLEHGTPPPTLSALVPAYLRAVPTDPFAPFGPLRYKPGGAKPLLYSLGPDGKDDGGKPICDTTKPAPSVVGALDQRYYVQPDSRGDVVAGVNTN